MVAGPKATALAGLTTGLKAAVAVGLMMAGLKAAALEEAVWSGSLFSHLCFCDAWSQCAQLLSSRF